MGAIAGNNGTYDLWSLDLTNSTQAEVVYGPTKVAGKKNCRHQPGKNEYPSAESAGHLILLCYQGSSNPIRRYRSIAVRAGLFAEKKNGVYVEGTGVIRAKNPALFINKLDAPAPILFSP